MTAEALALPRWNLETIYSSLAGDDYRQAVDLLQASLDQLEQSFAARGIGKLESAPSDRAQTMRDLSLTLDELNRLTTLSSTLSNFVYGHLTTDSYDSEATRETSRHDLLSARRQKLDIKLLAWIGDLNVTAADMSSETLRAHAYFLRQAAIRSRRMMPEKMEALATDLCLDAGTAFGKLQGNVTSQLQATIERDGKTERLPVAQIHNLCYDADRELRQRAYHAELSAWHSVRTTVAACLNGVKGTAATLARWRGRASVLEASLEDNHMDEATLEAMLSAIRDSLPIFRRYLTAKAGKLGLPRLSWWDLFAPVGGAGERIDWSAARNYIVEKFTLFSGELGLFAARAFDERWIDAAPRDGKRSGAYCMEIVGREESRVLANYDGSFEQLMTLAHELGHAYHNECQIGLPPLLRGAPMTLAETASIFCETLMAEAALSQAAPQDRVAILEVQLSGATQVCLDIYARYMFESSVFSRRSASELTSDEFCELMAAAQAETYADAVDPETYHRYMWLWKPHYYSHDYNFYNFPYAFGHLFALGLYDIFRREGAAFVPRYQQLLRTTNQDDAHVLAGRFGIDITRGEFWQGSLAVIAEQVARFERD